MKTRALSSFIHELFYISCGSGDTVFPERTVSSDGKLHCGRVIMSTAHPCCPVTEMLLRSEWPWWYGSSFWPSSQPKQRPCDILAYQAKQNLPLCSCSTLCTAMLSFFTCTHTLHCRLIVSSLSELPQSCQFTGVHREWLGQCWSILVISVITSFLRRIRHSGGATRENVTAGTGHGSVSLWPECTRVC